MPPFPFSLTSPMTRLPTEWVPPVCVKLPTAGSARESPLADRLGPGHGEESASAQDIRSVAAISVCVDISDDKAGHGMGPARLCEAADGQAEADRLSPGHAEESASAQGIRSAAAISVLVLIPDDKAGHGMGPARLREAADGGSAGNPPWPIDSLPVTVSWPPPRVYDPLPPFPYASTPPTTRLATEWVPPVCVKLPTAVTPANPPWPIDSLPVTVSWPPLRAYAPLPPFPFSSTSPTTRLAAE